MAKKLKAKKRNSKVPDLKVKTEEKVKTEVSQNSRSDSNACGIVGICLSVFIPIAGIALGILALSRREKTPALGIIAIILSVLTMVITLFFWVLIFSLPLTALSAV
jgi:hypothetical protein